MLTPAQELLWSLALAHRDFQFQSIQNALLNFIRSEEEWRSLTALAGKHRLLGTLVYVAKEMKDLLPFARDQARRTYDGIRLRYLYQETQLVVLREILAGLNVFPLKGHLLAKRCYASPELRPSGDIDLLLPSREILEAARRLTDAGFRLSAGQTFPWPPSEWMKSIPLEIDELVFERDSVVVELHSHIISYKLPHRFSSEELFGNATDTLSPLHFWIHLAINQHMHRFQGGLGGLLDLLLWEERNPLDLDELRKILDRCEIDYLVFPTLQRLKCIATDLPSTKLVAVSTAAELLFSSVEESKKKLVNHWYWIRQSRHRMKGLQLNLFPPRHRLAIRYGFAPYNPRLWVRRLSRPFELLRGELIR